MRRLAPLWLLVTGCKLFLPAPVPMGSVFDAQPNGGKARCLMVMLPGAGDTAEEFRVQGFVDEVRHSGASADVVAANATMGYYFRGFAPQRIEEDVLVPVRARASYQQIWLVGISMGGFGTFHYTQFFPEHVDGILALAPYLGDDAIGKEIDAAGGLAQWKPDAPAPVTEDNYQRQLWSWLKRVVVDKEPGPSIYIGYGDADGLGKQDGLLGAALPKDHVFHAPGGHDWPPWKSMFVQFLQSPEFKARCGPQ